MGCVSMIIGSESSHMAMSSFDGFLLGIRGLFEGAHPEILRSEKGQERYEFNR